MTRQTAVPLVTRDTARVAPHLHHRPPAVSFRQARLTSHIESVTSDSSHQPEPMCLLWTAVAPPMLQRLKLLKDLLGLYLSRRQAMALLARVHASNLSEDDRNHVSHILRAMLRRPEESLREPSSLEAPVPPVTAKRQRH
jgi:hypothetical protein